MSLAAQPKRNDGERGPAGPRRKYEHPELAGTLALEVCFKVKGWQSDLEESVFHERPDISRVEGQAL